MTRRVLFVAVALLALAWSRIGAAQAPRAISLFVAGPADAREPAAIAVARVDTVRARTTGVALAALDADHLALELFPGVDLQADLSRRETNGDGSVSWSGHVPDEPLSSVTFVRVGNVLQGSVRTLGAAYSIEPLGDRGVHTIRQVDLSRTGEELEPRVPPQRFADSSLDGSTPTGDDGNLIDVFVVYTAAARALAGGTEGGIRARIGLGVTETNTAYANSGIIPRLRLVGWEPVDYVESGDVVQDLERVTGVGDSFMDGVHARRDALGADLVQLVVAYPPPVDACGVAWLMQTLSTGFAANAFSVADYDCISPNYTFGHELGHNMGSNHAPEDPVTNTPLYPYSFGYKHPGQLFRTMMAYNCSGGCPRVLHFSNPAVNYNGSPTGTAARHNNALSINNARFTVANWRQAIDSASIPGPPADFSVSTVGTTATFSWSAPTTGLPPTTYVIEAGSGPGLSNIATLVTGSPATSFVVSGVPPGHFFIRVRARNAAGTSAASAELKLLMTPTGACTEPSGPPALFEPVVSGNKVRLSWGAPTSGGPADAYLVAAGSAPGAANLAVIDTGSAATALSVFAPKGLYFVRVGGRNQCGIGAASNEVSFRVGPQPPSPPSGLGFTLGAGGLVTLTWSAPSMGDAPTSYTVEAGNAPGRANLAVRQTGNTPTTLTIAAPPGTYFVRVRASNGAGTGAPSNEVTVEVP